jgi:hypothetical protein
VVPAIYIQPKLAAVTQSAHLVPGNGMLREDLAQETCCFDDSLSVRFALFGI